MVALVDKYSLLLLLFLGSDSQLPVQHTVAVFQKCWDMWSSPTWCTPHHQQWVLLYVCVCVYVCVEEGLTVYKIKRLSKTAQHIIVHGQCSILTIVKCENVVLTCFGVIKCVNKYLHPKCKGKKYSIIKATKVYVYMPNVLACLSMQA